MKDDLAAKHRDLAKAAGDGKAPSPVGGDPAQCGQEHGLRGRTGSGINYPRSTRPDRATRWIETSQGTLSYAELAPLLAVRVATLEAKLQKAIYAGHAMDEDFFRLVHREICADLVPDWSGCWRKVEVRVGRLKPPLPHEVPMRMRDFTLDLQARWDSLRSDREDDLADLLAFAEGRFLTIHPFLDFNGRTIRLVLTEILRRLDLPMVELAPETDDTRQNYFAALEAADRSDFAPLQQLWKLRFQKYSDPAQ